jgi:hypothetical protein
MMLALGGGYHLERFPTPFSQVLSFHLVHCSAIMSEFQKRLESDLQVGDHIRRAGMGGIRYAATELDRAVNQSSHLLLIAPGDPLDEATHGFGVPTACPISLTLGELVGGDRTFGEFQEQ